MSHDHCRSDFVSLWLAEEVWEGGFAAAMIGLATKIIGFAAPMTKLAAAMTCFAAPMIGFAAARTALNQDYAVQTADRMVDQRLDSSITE